MGLTHIRTPKHFVLEERLERYASAIEQHPEAYAGRWAEACWPLAAHAPASTTPGQAPGRYRAIHLDLGCGKGSFLVAAAERDPETLFIGADIEPICIAYAAQRIVEHELSNALVIPRGAHALDRIFAPGELAAITLNFPTPHPRSHDADRRLTNVDHLLSFRALLAPGGSITLRTDSQPLRDYSLVQFRAAGYRIIWSSDDVRAEHPGFPETEYEHRLIERGAPVWGIHTMLGPAPTADEIEHGRTAPRSLMTYLPDDLEHLTYVPLGMEAAVTNFVNRRRREQRH